MPGVHVPRPVVAWRVGGEPRHNVSKEPLLTTATLHLGRLAIPGILAILAGVSLLAPGGHFFAAISSIDFKVASPLFGLALVIGAMYLLADARERFSISFSWEDVHDTIHSTLLESVRERRQLTEEEEEFLLQNRRLLNVFYRLIDNDLSLKARQDSIRLNGLIVTSAADLAIVSITATILHFLAALFELHDGHAFWIAGCVACWVLCEAILIPAALNRHRRLASEQLAYIADNLPVELDSKVATALQRLQSHSQPAGNPRDGEGEPRVSEDR